MTMHDIDPMYVPSQLLRRTFQHLPGISAAREAKLRSEGLDDWGDLLAREPSQLELFGRRGSALRFGVDESEEALSNGDVSFFKRKLPKREFYRIAASFPDRCVFLDIESTGLSKHYDEVTLVGWSVGSGYEVLVDPKGTGELESDLQANGIVVTFNGTLFDLPFLTSRFQTDWSQAMHVDLRYLAKRVGLTGGQKKIEDMIGFAREGGVQGVTGAEAVGLWFDYKEGDLGALRKLIRYNHADIEGMKFLFERVVQRLEEEKEKEKENARSVTLFKRSRVRFTERNARRIGDGIRVCRYCGPVGPRMVLSDLCERVPRLSGTTLIGIDLTGSQKRKSGWAAVTGGEVTTELIATDAELMEKTLAARPFLVSIDSPLSLPAGRRTEFDDDPGRDQYGIVREAERQLRKRGINVYPALLPSMQRLTRRGVQIAALLRKSGVPVIESYPGAAQDILGIPRKKTSLKHLFEGLRRFGYQFLTGEPSVSHDELDAATSALVGQFMLAGYWEALGSAEEDYLIVPTVERMPGSQRADVVIGVSGPIAAGKTSAARVLERAGFRYCRFSEVLEEEARALGKASDRNTLQALGEKAFSSRFGQRRLQNKLAKTVEGARRIVVDGLRHPEDSAFLRERWGFAALHVHIGAGVDLRERRYRARPGRTEIAFGRASAHAVEQNVSVLECLADYRVVNDGTLGALEHELAGLLVGYSACR